MTLNQQIGTLLEVKDHIALWMGVADYASLETEEQNIVDIAISRALRLMSRDIKGIWIEREGSFVTGVNTVGGANDHTTLPLFGNFLLGNNVVTTISLSSGGPTINPITEGVSVDDLLTAGGLGKGAIKIDARDSTTITMEETYPGADATQQSFTVARNRYLLDAGVLWITHVWDVKDARPIPVLTRSQWIDITGGLYETGSPAYAIIEGAHPSEITGTGTNQKLSLWPVPDDHRVIKYVYYTLPTYPAADGTEFEVTPNSIDLLIHKTLEYVFWHRQDAEMRDRHAIEYARLLREAVREEMGRGDDILMHRPQWEDGMRHTPRFPEFIISPFPIGVQ